MQLTTKLFALGGLLLLFLLLVELVRRNKLREDYSILWFSLVFVFAGLIFLDSVLLSFIQFLGGTNISSLFFAFGILFALIMLIHLTAIVSDLKRKQNVLIEENGLLRENLKKIEKPIRECEDENSEEEIQ
ncbi:DUF2304 domain-containing protein [bacterium]|nr:DUF2304 domain-containing protein [bacterium]